MDDAEFRKLLDLFPVVRSRDYHAEPEASKASTSQSAPDEITSWQDAWEENDEGGKTSKVSNKEDAFWKKLRLAAEKKLNRAEAESFVASFQRIHKKLVFEKLNPDTARNILDANQCK